MQRQLAEENFQQARSAVDTFSSLSETELAYRPDLQDLRRSFLETSLEFYRDFLEVRSDDPALAVQLASTSARVEQLVDELRVLDNVSPLLQLTEPSIREELGFSPGNSAPLDEAITEFQSQLRATANQFVGSLGSDNGEMTSLLRDFDALISAELTDEQLKRLRQIARQRRLPFTFKTSEVVAALGLTRDQRSDINRIIVETRPTRGGGPPRRPPGDPRDNRRGPPQRDPRHSPEFGSDLGPGFGRDFERDHGPGFDGGFRPGGPPPEFDGFRGPKPPHDMERAAVTRNTVNHILEILTPEQRTKWDELVGPPFNPRP
jgi:hypothetical protein